MSKIKITDESFRKFEDDVVSNLFNFDTNQEVEVRIPFEGYFSLKVKCKDAQVAMVAVLKANSDIGIMHLEGGKIEIEDVLEKETYSLIVKEPKT